MVRAVALLTCSHVRPLKASSPPTPAPSTPYSITPEPSTPSTNPSPLTPHPSPLLPSTPSPRALSLQPEQAGVHSAMGYTLQLMGQLDEAIQQYHVALSVQPDDAFTRDMLTKALHDFASVE